MLKVRSSHVFGSDLKLAKKRHFDINLLEEVVNKLYTNKNIDRFEGDLLMLPQLGAKSKDSNHPQVGDKLDGPNRHQLGDKLDNSNRQQVVDKLVSEKLS